MSAPSAPAAGATAWWGSALVAIAVIGGLTSMQPLVGPGPWVEVGTALVVGLAVVTALVRRTSRSSTAPTSWGLAAGVLALAAVYGGTTSSASVPMPTPDTLDRLVRLARSGVTAIAESTVPLEPVRGAELLLVAGAVVAFLLTDLLALGLRRGALSGLPLAALWTPVAVFELAAPVGSVLVGGVAFLLLLALTRPTPAQGARGLGRDARPALVAAAGVAVLALVAGPVVSATPVFGSVRLPAAWGSGGLPAGPLSLSDDLDMRASLGDRSDRAVLTYTTTIAELGPLRMFTMTDFDGREWGRGDVSGPVTPAEGVLWPGPTGPPPEEGSAVQIRIGDLDGDRLPIPLEPRAVDIGGAWTYDHGRDEVVGQGTTRGVAYEVAVLRRDLSSDALRADAPGEVEADSPYLALPETEHSADIRDLAVQLTSDATTAYDRALALQSYFRDITTFSYDPDVPPAQTDDAVWDFLNQRTGYCVQYATAMTVMARTLGIPARMGVGFLPGRPTSQGSATFVVSGRQAHTWPELFFQDAGWVRFEPTPQSQTGAPPSYADPFSEAPFATEEQIPGATAQPSMTVPPPTTGQTGTAPGGQVRVGSADVPVVAFVAGGGLLLVALAALTWVLRRRRAVEVPHGPEEWWAELRGRLAEHDITWSDADTPRQAADALRDRYPTTAGDEELAGARRGLSKLVAAVENARYSPAPRSWEDADLQSWVEAAVQPVASSPAPSDPVGTRA